jgi:hypothetical protein
MKHGTNRKRYPRDSVAQRIWVDLKALVKADKEPKPEPRQHVPMEEVVLRMSIDKIGQLVALHNEGLLSDEETLRAVLRVLKELQ